MSSRNNIYLILSLFMFLWLSSAAAAGSSISVGETPGRLALEKEKLQEWNNLIRREKFDIVLPKAMRQNNVDMWIHVKRIAIPDSFGAAELGSTSGVFVFTDRGGDRIERVVFEGEVADPSAYDIVRGRSKYINQENYEIMEYMAENPDLVLETELDLRFLGLRDFVAERDPQRIAVNYIESLSFPEGSETFTMAMTDGLSYTDYRQLVKTLGETYAERMVSAEHLILDYLSRRVAAEVVLYGTSGNLRERTRKFNKIVPGVSTLKKIGGGSVIDKDGRRHRDDDYVIQRGDYIDGWGRRAYVLRKGETGLPSHLRKFWKDVDKIRDIFRKNIKVGPTAGETLEILIQKLDEAGFVHHDRQIYDRFVGPEKTQVAIDSHAEGKGILAPRISHMGPKWHWNVKISLFHMFAIEYFVFMDVPEWEKANNSTGQRLYVMFHDGGVVTGRGMETAYPEQSREIQIIH